jgi:hypothetical protein
MDYQAPVYMRTFDLMRMPVYHIPVASMVHHVRFFNSLGLNKMHRDWDPPGATMWYNGYWGVILHIVGESDRKPSMSVSS